MRRRSAAKVVVAMTDDEDAEQSPIVPGEVSKGIDEEEAQSGVVESISASVFSAIFLLFSYTIQFLGALFSIGLLLNLSGFGYTFDLESGLKIDKIANIRNEVQFEREIEREERMERKGMSSQPSKYIIAPEVPESGL